MLLTIKQPTQQTYKSFHEYTPPTPPSTSRFSPALSNRGPGLPTVSSNTSHSLPPLGNSTSSFSPPMSQPHRGLPPPAAMIPQQQQQSGPLDRPSLSQSMGALPAPPSQWQGGDETMRNWLHAKAEEDKRKQEEEKTRQESLRLEQRKIEQDMLRTSLSGGIPPYMIPMVFAGMGGGNLPNASLEWAQQYMAQAQQQQHLQNQQQHQLLQAQAHTSPEQIQRRDSRGYMQTHPSTVTLPSTPIGQPSGQSSSGYVPSHPMSPGARSRQLAQQSGGTIIRSTPTSHLPRLNTGEMHIQPPPPGPVSHQNVPGHPLQQTQTVQQEASSPSIYFHHWQPPTSQAGSSSNNPPSTPSDQTSSPRKRKATGSQQPAPPPTSQPQYTSPPFSQGSASVASTPQGRRTGHSRQRSDVSTRGNDYHRSNRHSKIEGGFISHNLASPMQSADKSQSHLGSRRLSGGAHTVSSMLQQDEPERPPQQQEFHASPRVDESVDVRRRNQYTPEADLARHKSMIKRDSARD